jgi:hypothetical protein
VVFRTKFGIPVEEIVVPPAWETDAAIQGVCVACSSRCSQGITYSITRGGEHTGPFCQRACLESWQKKQEVDCAEEARR